MIHESNDVDDEKGHDHDLNFNMYDDNFSDKESEKEFLLLGTDEDLLTSFDTQTVTYTATQL